MLFFFVAQTINSIFSSATSELNRLCAAEGTLVFHGVKHSHSYLSQSCTTNLTKKCFSDSILAKNITCSKTKVEFSVSLFNMLLI
jgi:hypothetical protein